MNWNELTIKDKAAVIRLAVALGLRNLDDIHSIYDEFSYNQLKGGGPTNKKSNSKPAVSVRKYKPTDILDWQVEGRLQTKHKERQDEFLRHLEDWFKAHPDSEFNTPEWRRYITSLPIMEGVDYMYGNDANLNAENSVHARGYFQMMPTSRRIKGLWKNQMDQFDDYMAYLKANNDFINKNTTKEERDYLESLGFDIYALNAAAHLGGVGNYRYWKKNPLTYDSRINKNDGGTNMTSYAMTYTLMPKYWLDENGQMRADYDVVDPTAYGRFALAQRVQQPAVTEQLPPLQVGIKSLIDEIELPEGELLSKIDISDTPVAEDEQEVSLYRYPVRKPRVYTMPTLNSFYDAAYNHTPSPLELLVYGDLIKGLHNNALDSVYDDGGNIDNRQIISVGNSGLHPNIFDPEAGFEEAKQFIIDNLNSPGFRKRLQENIDKGYIDKDEAEYWINNFTKYPDLVTGLSFFDTKLDNDGGELVDIDDLTNANVIDGNAWVFPKDYQYNFDTDDYDLMPKHESEFPINAFEPYYNRGVLFKHKLNEKDGVHSDNTGWPYVFSHEFGHILDAMFGKRETMSNFDKLTDNSDASINWVFPDYGTFYTDNTDLREEAGFNKSKPYSTLLRNPDLFDGEETVISDLIANPNNALIFAKDNVDIPEKTGMSEDRLFHDYKPGEDYGDIWELRKKLADTGIYDSRSVEPITKQQLEEYKAKVPQEHWGRIFDNQEDDVILYLLNHTALNLNNSLSQPVFYAAYGGHLFNIGGPTDDGDDDNTNQDQYDAYNRKMFGKTFPRYVYGDIVSPYHATEESGFPMYNQYTDDEIDYIEDMVKQNPNYKRPQNLLPEVTVPGYRPAILDTWYPLSDEYPIGHSKLAIPVGDKWIYVDKKPKDEGYNLFTDNCADATLYYMNAMADSVGIPKYHPLLFTDPGDVKELAKKIGGHTKKLTGKAGRDRRNQVVIPMNEDMLKAVKEAYNNPNAPSGAKMYYTGGPIKNPLFMPELDNQLLWPAVNSVPFKVYSNDNFDAGAKIETFIPSESGYPSYAPEANINNYINGVLLTNPNWGGNSIVYNPKYNNNDTLILDSLHLMHLNPVYEQQFLDLVNLLLSDPNNTADLVHNIIYNLIWGDYEDKEELNNEVHRLLEIFLDKDYYSKAKRGDVNWKKAASGKSNSDDKIAIESALDGFLRNQFAPDYLRNIEGGYGPKYNLPDNILQKVDTIQSILESTILPEVDVYPLYAKGGSIHINPKNKGKFSAAAKRAGMSTQLYASHVLANKGKYSSTLVKRANFARNASKWKHPDGGPLNNKYVFPVNKSTEEDNNYNIIVGENGLFETLKSLYNPYFSISGKNFATPEEARLDDEAYKIALKLTEQTNNIPLTYTGGTKEEAREKFWLQEPVLQHAVDSVANLYNVSPQALKYRINKEGFVDHEIHNRNIGIGINRPERGYDLLNKQLPVAGGYGYFGLDYLGDYLRNGDVDIKGTRWYRDKTTGRLILSSPQYHVNYYAENEHGVQVDPATGRDVADNIGGVAATLAMFKKLAKKDFPNATNDLLDKYALTYYNRGRTAGRRWIKAGHTGYDYEETPMNNNTMRKDTRTIIEDKLLTNPTIKNAWNILPESARQEAVKVAEQYGVDNIERYMNIFGLRGKGGKIDKPLIYAGHKGYARI